MEPETPSFGNKERLRVVIHGAVQGVGFRPFIYQLAADLQLHGWVCNDAQGVQMELEGSSANLRQFLVRLPIEKPPHSMITSLEPSFLDPLNYPTFEIRESQGGAKTALVLPDIATCGDCLNELLDSTNRRYRYPFTNCTHCGPRYSFIEALPYDRARTTMKGFPMCVSCQTEYDNPQDRRFHAQPNACPACGPQLELWERDGRLIAGKNEALQRAASALSEGKILAVKGLGGFHLWVDARNEQAVQTLRQRKHRQEKPLALMIPDSGWAKTLCELSAMEERLLCSAEAPIVLLRRRPSNSVAESVAPKNPYLGLMLPYTPLHHLLLREFPFPVVATSGNISEEPLCIDERLALEDLGSLADLFLVHNRPIARPVDDSVVCVIEDRELVLRRARGYAPLPVQLTENAPPLLAVGAHLKNTIAAAIGPQVFMSQHIGDLETARAFETFKQTIQRFEALYDFKPEQVVCDLHPNYVSTRHAARMGCTVIPVQHHYAHILSCMAENHLEGPALGVAWDGSGYGLDHTIWGGEFLRITSEGFERAAHLRVFRLPGGEKAVREPRRSALGVLFEIFGEGILKEKGMPSLDAFSTEELTLLGEMLAKHVQAPVTSSMGRLFDAVASLTNLSQLMRFEGQAAMELEFAIPSEPSEASYPFLVKESESSLVIDWEPMVRSLLDDIRCQTSLGEMACRFHNGLVEALVNVAGRLKEHRVVLSGGCFQNRYLTTRAIRRLRAEGFEPYWHQRVPPNDGGLALGQVAAAARILKGAPLCA